MRKPILFLCAAATLVAAGCRPRSEQQNEAQPATRNESAESQLALKGVPAPAADPSKCPITRSFDWRAIVVPQSAGGPEALYVIGDVETATTGYEMHLVPGPLDRAQPPSQRFNLEVTDPTGMVLQLVTTHPVWATVTPAQPQYRDIIISCRGQELARINVERSS